MTVNLLGRQDGMLSGVWRVPATTSCDCLIKPLANKTGYNSCNKRSLHMINQRRYTRHLVHQWGGDKQKRLINVNGTERSGRTVNRQNTNKNIASNLITKLIFWSDMYHRHSCSTVAMVTMYLVGYNIVTNDTHMVGNRDLLVYHL